MLPVLSESLKFAVGTVLFARSFMTVSFHSACRICGEEPGSHFFGGGQQTQDNQPEEDFWMD